MSFAAVRPGTDLGRHARQLLRTHDAVLGNTTPATVPRRVVAESWQRVLQAGLDPSACNARDPVPWEETERRRVHSRLRPVVEDLVQAVAGVADASHLLLVITDADGVVLWREGASRVRRQADALGFSEGAEWTERRVGTNAIGTALAEQAPVQLFSAEHFEQGQHAWYCTAHPVHDPRTGELLGIVDISGPALTLHPAIEALVQTAVRLAETRLRCAHEIALGRLRTAAEPVLAGITGPALVVDDDGWVAHARDIAHRDRIELPHDGEALAVPGLGVCLPERLRDGWLVRPSGQARSVRAVLDLGAATLTVESGSMPWRVDLSPRHVQLLALLHAAGAAGLTAAGLSRAVFGDDAHLVTVRAEISRLRRLAGALIATRPYRVHPGVVLDIGCNPLATVSSAAPTGRQWPA